MEIETKNNFCRHGGLPLRNKKSKLNSKYFSSRIAFKPEIGRRSKTARAGHHFRLINATRSVKSVFITALLFYPL